MHPGSLTFRRSARGWWECASHNQPPGSCSVQDCLCEESPELETGRKKFRCPGTQSQLEGSNLVGARSCGYLRWMAYTLCTVLTSMGEYEQTRMFVVDCSTAKPLGQ